MRAMRSIEFLRIFS